MTELLIYLKTYCVIWVYDSMGIECMDGCISLLTSVLSSGIFVTLDSMFFISRLISATQHSAYGTLSMYRIMNFKAHGPQGPEFSFLKTDASLAQERAIRELSMLGSRVQLIWTPVACRRQIS